MGFKASDERNRLVDETAGMMKLGRETHYEKYYAWDLQITYKVEDFYKNNDINLQRY